jgi:hypothetical protein
MSNIRIVQGILTDLYQLPYQIISKLLKTGKKFRLQKLMTFMKSFET